MSADLHIHIFEGITEDNLAEFFSATLGSKYHSWSVRRRSDEVYDLVANTPGILIGEVSWLKAFIFDAGEEYIPSTIEKVSAIIGEDLPILDDKMITEILSAFDLPNVTQYELANKEKVRIFLEEHKGKQVFTVSW